MPENGKKIEYLPPRLMIAVGVPAYKIVNGPDGNDSYVGLLGVASTDVPVDEIDKLTLPYKVGIAFSLILFMKCIPRKPKISYAFCFLLQLGVNAYPFIVSNNGYVLLHPDLRPMVIVFHIFIISSSQFRHCILGNI